MLVSVHRESDRGVAERFGGHLWMNARLEQCRRVGVAQVVESEARKVELVCQPVDRSRQGIGRHGPPIAAVNHDPRIQPRRADDKATA